MAAIPVDMVHADRAAGPRQRMLQVAEFVGVLFGVGLMAGHTASADARPSPQTSLSPAAGLAHHGLLTTLVGRARGAFHTLTAPASRPSRNTKIAPAPVASSAAVGERVAGSAVFFPSSPVVSRPAGPELPVGPVGLSAGSTAGCGGGAPAPGSAGVPFPAARPVERRSSAVPGAARFAGPVVPIDERPGAFPFDGRGPRRPG